MPARIRLLCSLLSVLVAAVVSVPMASSAQAASCKQVSGHTLSSGYAGFVCASKSRVHRPKRPNRQLVPETAAVPPAVLDMVMAGSSQVDVSFDTVAPPMSASAPVQSPARPSRPVVVVCPPALDPGRVTIMPIVTPLDPIAPIDRDQVIDLDPVADPIVHIMGR